MFASDSPFCDGLEFWTEEPLGIFALGMFLTFVVIIPTWQLWIQPTFFPTEEDKKKEELARRNRASYRPPPPVTDVFIEYDRYPEKTDFHEHTMARMKHVKIPPRPNRIHPKWDTAWKRFWNGRFGIGVFTPKETLIRLSNEEWEYDYIWFATRRPGEVYWKIRSYGRYPGERESIDLGEEIFASIPMMEKRVEIAISEGEARKRAWDYKPDMDDRICVGFRPDEPHSSWPGAPELPDPAPVIPGVREWCKTYDYYGRPE